MFGALYRDNHDSRGLMGITETLAAQNRMDDAIKEMDKAIAAEPDRQDLKLGRANFYVRAQRYDEAIATFKAIAGKGARTRPICSSGWRRPIAARAISIWRRIRSANPARRPPTARFRCCNWA